MNDETRKQEAAEKLVEIESKLRDVNEHLRRLEAEPESFVVLPGLTLPENIRKSCLNGVAQSLKSHASDLSIHRYVANRIAKGEHTLPHVTPKPLNCPCIVCHGKAVVGEFGVTCDYCCGMGVMCGGNRLSHKYDPLKTPVVLEDARQWLGRWTLKCLNARDEYVKDYMEHFEPAIA